MNLLKKDSIVFRAIAVSLACVCLVTFTWEPAYAQVLSLRSLPQPGLHIQPSQEYKPLLIKGMEVFPDEPLRFDFMVHQGEQALSSQALQAESARLARYFFAALTVPQGDFWVNLSPHESERIIPDPLGRTELGRDLLAQDYILKHLTASLLHPDGEAGKRFWRRVYAQAHERFGTTEIPVDTFHKVWITPESASVYEHENRVYITDATLNVMLEQDYVAQQHHRDIVPGTRRLNTDSDGLSSDIMREIIIPELEREVNEGQHFAPLRQIFHALILAKWYKQAIQDSLMAQVYVDQNHVTGIDTENPETKEKLYTQYVALYEQGVMDMIREEMDPFTQTPLPRHYFSGGVQDWRFPLLRDSGAQAKAYFVDGRDENHVLYSTEGVPVQHNSPVSNVSQEATVMSTLLFALLVVGLVAALMIKIKKIQKERVVQATYADSAIGNEIRSMYDPDVGQPNSPYARAYRELYARLSVHLNSERSEYYAIILLKDILNKKKQGVDYDIHFMEILPGVPVISDGQSLSAEEHAIYKDIHIDDDRGMVGDSNNDDHVNPDISSLGMGGMGVHDRYPVSRWRMTLAFIVWLFKFLTNSPQENMQYLLAITKLDQEEQRNQVLLAIADMFEKNPEATYAEEYRLFKNQLPSTMQGEIKRLKAVTELSNFLKLKRAMNANLTIEGYMRSNDQGMLSADWYAKAYVWWSDKQEQKERRKHIKELLDRRFHNATLPYKNLGSLIHEALARMPKVSGFDPREKVLDLLEDILFYGQYGFDYEFEVVPVIEFETEFGETAVTDEYDVRVVPGDELSPIIDVNDENKHPRPEDTVTSKTKPTSAQEIIAEKQKRMREMFNRSALLAVMGSICAAGGGCASSGYDGRDDWLDRTVNHYQERSRHITPQYIESLNQSIDRLEASKKADARNTRSSEESAPTPLRDNSLNVSSAMHGGIDMNTVAVDRQGDQTQIVFNPVTIQALIHQRIEGLKPVMVEMRVLPSVLPLLGLTR